MRTLAQIINIHGVDVEEHLDRQTQVPVSSGLQRQGDVIVIPTQLLGLTVSAHTSVMPAGVPVVQGGNTHLLLADGGPVFYDVLAVLSDRLALGVLTVVDGSTAYLAHPEHGYVGIAPGTYVIRRQREQADVIRLVAD